MIWYGIPWKSNSNYTLSISRQIKRIRISIFMSLLFLMSSSFWFHLKVYGPSILVLISRTRWSPSQLLSLVNYWQSCCTFADKDWRFFVWEWSLFWEFVNDENMYTCSNKKLYDRTWCVPISCLAPGI